MHDEVLMGVMHCSADCLKQLQTRSDIQTVRVAVDVDGDAVDVLHDDVRATIR